MVAAVDRGSSIKPVAFIQRHIPKGIPAIGFLVDRIIVGVALAFYYDKLTRTKHDS